MPKPFHIVFFCIYIPILKNNIVSSLSINRFDETEIMYNKLMEGLKALFVKFNEVIE